mmetsp:Transcript_14709/g.44196  ORF Transcript_14709/g.44196 Transcript_14709/m.44196 type:complete len:474 (-) Transcript_14709:2563-3984(-)
MAHAAELLQIQDPEDHAKRIAATAPIVALLKEHGFLTEEKPCVDVFDFDKLRANVAHCQEHLPAPMFHFFAVKACPLTGVMKELLKLGMGAECASITEVEHALAMGFEAHKVCFDSPAKTRTELVRAISAGCVVNMDGHEEIEKVKGLFESGRLTEARVMEQKMVGVRINPCQTEGTIAITSTNHKGSKFGLQVHAGNMEERIAMFKANPWIRGLHMHVGSQGMEISQIVDSARALFDLAAAIGTLPNGERQISYVDLGGGLSVNYGKDELPRFDEYGRQMREKCPEAFDGTYRMYTEFGRSIACKCGIAASTIEIVKMTTQDGEPRRTVLCHLGSNQYLRPVYKPDKYAHRVTLHKAAGTSDANMRWHDIAGPLCFSGDVIAKRRWLPSADEGDTVVLHDTGAYTYAMYSRYNSRPAPPAVSIETATDATNGVMADGERAAKRTKTNGSGHALTLKVLTHGETLSDLIRFWS